MVKWKKLHEIRLGTLHFLILAVILLVATVGVLRSISASEFAELNKPPASGLKMPAHRQVAPPLTPIIKAAKTEE
ncbi:MAG: hypothetical protein ACFCUJ_04470 [Thiotrichales bacterium]